MTESSASAVWLAGYETALDNVLWLLRNEFPKPTLGIQKAIKLVETMGVEF